MSKYVVKLESISPIHIGNGEEYFSTFIRDGIRLNEEIIFEEFTKQILRGVDIEKISERFNELKSYVEHLENSLIERAYLYKFDELDKSITSKEVRVQEILKENENGKIKPLIPGSTIKGYILTLMLLKELEEANESVIIEANRVYVKVGKKRRPLLNSLIRNPTLIERFREEIEKFIKLKNFSVSDCVLNNYKIKLGKLYIWRRGNPIFIEVLDEFSGKCEIEADFDLEDLIKNYGNKFARRYLEKLEKLEEIVPGTKEKINEIKKELENENLIIVGKYTNLYSKSIHLLPENKLRFLKERFEKIRLPRILKIFEINGKKQILGMVKVKIEKLS